MSARLRFLPQLSVVQSARRDGALQIAGRVARNVRELRKAAGCSLDALSRKAGVSRAMLGQIETAKSVPTITVLWRIAEALNVEVGALIAAPGSSPVRIIDAPQQRIASDTGVSKREFSGSLSDQRGAVVEILIEPGSTFSLASGAAGTELILIGVRGETILTVEDADEFLIVEREAISFYARDSAKLENRSGAEARILLVRIARFAIP